MVDISSIIINNTLFEVKQGCTLEAILKLIKEPFLLDKDYNNETVILIDYIQMFFTSNVFDFGIIKFWPGIKVICFDNEVDKETTLDIFRDILDSLNISYVENEVSNNDQLNLELENHAIIIFDFNKKQYRLIKIVWGGRV